MIYTASVLLARTRGRARPLWRARPSAAAAAAVVQCGGAPQTQQTRFSHSVVADEDKYLELKQLRDIKSEEFYDVHGQERRYFYYIDLQGRLFLENTRPKNIATSLKSAKFLRFFFSQIRPNDPPTLSSSSHGSAGDAPQKDQSLLFLEYPYRSPCGKEMNFIKCADRPFVFEDFYQKETSSGRKDWVLAYGGGELTVPFQPDRLKISLSTGRLYHDIKTKYAAPGTGGAGIALIKSQLAVEFGRSISVLNEPIEVDSSHDTERSSDGDGDGDDGESSKSGGALIIGEFEWQGEKYPIQAIE